MCMTHELARLALHDRDDILVYGVCKNSPGKSLNVTFLPSWASTALMMKTKSLVMGGVASSLFEYILFVVLY